MQRYSGRNLRKSPFHDKIAKSGAFFGCAGGFERPMFFLGDMTNNELEIPPYDYYGYYGNQKRSQSMYEKVLTIFILKYGEL